MTKKILVLGALSEIAEATCRLYAAQGAKLFVTGRNEARLKQLVDDLLVRGAAAVHFEAADLAVCDPEEALKRWTQELGGVEMILLAYGVLGEQRALERDLRSAAALIDTNFRSAALWSIASANHLEAAGSGVLVVIGSVAGDRGRQSNYLYGATKGGLAILVQGLAHRLAARGARAVLVKPGFVDTAMTAHIAKKGALWSKPDRIARLIFKAAESGKPIAYVPGYWRLIMTVIKAVPAPVFHRTKL